jgi:hypothetical protein
VRFLEKGAAGRGAQDKDKEGGGKVSGGCGKKIAGLAPGLGRARSAGAQAPLTARRLPRGRRAKASGARRQP